MEGEERKGEERQASKCQDVYIRCTTYSRYYTFLGTIVLTTLSINQLICLSIHLSIYPSIRLSVYCTCTKSACLLAYLLAGLLTCLLAVVIERSNYIISYYVMLHGHIHYYYYHYY